MVAFVRAFRVAGARGGGHQHYGREGAAAVLAGVLGLLGAFVEFVIAFVDSVRMSGAKGMGELVHRGEFVPAVLAVVVFRVRRLLIVAGGQRQNEQQQSCCDDISFHILDVFQVIF